MKLNCCALLIVFLAAGVGCSPGARDRTERHESAAPEAGTPLSVLSDPRARYFVLEKAGTPELKPVATSNGAA